MSKLRVRQRGSIGRCVMGGWKVGGRWCALDGEEGGGGGGGGGGCRAAVERSERRLQSLLMGELRLCCHSSEALWLIRLLISDGPVHRGGDTI